MLESIQSNRVEETDPYTLMWIREEFYKAYSGRKDSHFWAYADKKLP